MLLFLHIDPRDKWIRKPFDAEGYFLFKFVGEITDHKDMFLTADDTSSLTIKGT